MRRKGLLRKYLSVELVFIWLLRGTVFSFASSVQSVPSGNSCGFSLTRQISHVALVGILLPWTMSEGSTSAVGKETETNRGHTAATTSSVRKPKAVSSYKTTSANNALLSNIDFLTQLTNSKQEKNSEMDPLKCFPKALCGLSAESAAITRRRKNGLITDYIRLMKAVALNPSVMDDTMKKLKGEEADQRQEEETAAASDSDSEADDDDDDDDDEDEDRRRSSKFEKRSSQVGEVSYKKKSISEKKLIKKTKKKKKEEIPKDSDEFMKHYLREKSHVEKLMDDGYNNEDGENTNWWAYENDKEDPSLEALVDFSGSKLDSQSVESYYTFGGKKKPNPPKGPGQPEGPSEPKAPKLPKIPPRQPPPMQRPPASPLQQYNNNHESGGSGFSNFFRGLFGGSSFSKDPFFEGFARALPDGTPTIVTVDKTKEILTTAIEIGETLSSPNQCNGLFNGCRYQYIELLHVIDEIRQGLANKGKYGFDSPFYNGIAEYKGTIGSGNLKDGRKDSYGYKSKLSEISQAEILVPDYQATESKITKKKRRHRKKENKSYRNGKMNPASRDTSMEIGSDEPTMYGSAQQNFDQKHPQFGMHHQKNYHRHSYYNPQLNQQFEDAYDRQPKSIWATILSWFGFGR